MIKIRDTLTWSRINGRDATYVACIAVNAKLRGQAHLNLRNPSQNIGILSSLGKDF